MQPALNPPGETWRDRVLLDKLSIRMVLAPSLPFRRQLGAPFLRVNAPALGLSMDARSHDRGDISVETCVCSRAQATPIKSLSSDWSLLFCHPILLRDQFATPCCLTCVDRCATRQHASQYRLLWKGTKYEHQTKGWCRFRKASAGSKATIKTTALTAVRDVLYDDVCVCRSGCLAHMCMQHVFLIAGMFVHLCISLRMLADAPGHAQPRDTGRCSDTSIPDCPRLQADHVCACGEKQRRVTEQCRSRCCRGGPVT